MTNQKPEFSITNRILKILGALMLIAGVFYVLWRFSFIIVYILIAAVVSFIGHPLVRLLDKLRVGKFRLPHSVNSLIALLFLLACVVGLFAMFVPLILQQADTISRIDFNKLSSDLQGPLAWLQEKLVQFEIIKPGESLQAIIAEKAKEIVNLTNLNTLVNGVVGIAGSLAVDLFSVLFISFFFLKDETMFEDMLLAVVPEKHVEATKKVYKDSKYLLRRYFIGVTFEIIGGMTLITIGLLILGVENALLIGFFGGLMNIIPYLGALVGTAFGLTLGITGIIATGDYAAFLPLTLKIAGVFITVHELDTTFYQPFIYASSIKAHPLEIFFAIIIGGSVGGVVGMLIAVPVYTLLRVIAREFFSNFKVVRELTNEKTE